MDYDRIKIITDVVENGKSKNAAAVKLNRSMKTVNRMINAFIEKGECGLIHGNKGRKPANSLDHDAIFDLYKDKYFDFNMTHFSELLQEREQIIASEGTIRNIFKERDTLSIRARKRTKRELKKKLASIKKLNEDQKDQLIQLETEAFTGSAHPTQPRSKYFGEEIQMDASNHLWFGKTKAHLHLAIDDATGMIVGGYFDTQETLKGYYSVLQQILTVHGIPVKFKTDRRTIFEYKSKKRKEMSEDTFTQFTHACNTLGIDLEAKSIPEFKPRVERSFQTLQGRLPQEMRLAGVTTLDEANEFLNSYILKFNQQFAIIDTIESCFELQPTQEQIDQTLVTFTKRTVDNGNAILLNKKNFSLHDSDGQQKFLRPKTKVSVITMMNGSQFVMHNEKLYALEEIPERQKSSKLVDFNYAPSPARPKKNIPAFDHPWRISNSKFFRNNYGYYG
ncbi:MAG TPA: ISNCY family transposase [Treponemataceae bacterium]|nr:ISNCY family transposase [Treponemataceae bacterium]